MASSYDDIAGMYDVFWSDWYLPAAMPALEKLFFSRIPGGARVLDVCCGSGHVTKELARREYRVTGVDGSAALIDIARHNLPAVNFYVQDVERLAINGRFEAALSTFDSMNHILSLEGVQRAFARIHEHLVPGGTFLFDMNLEEAYFLDLTEWQVSFSENATGLVRGRYDRLQKKASTELIWFRKQRESETWTRHQSVVEQRCYPEGELVLALREAGFEQIEAIMADQTGMRPDMAVGRMFFVAIR